MPRFLLICLCLSAFTGCVSSQPANPNLETLEGYGEPVKQNDWGGAEKELPASPGAPQIPSMATSQQAAPSLAPAPQPQPSAAQPAYSDPEQPEYSAPQPSVQPGNLAPMERPAAPITTPQYNTGQTAAPATSTNVHAAPARAASQNLPTYGMVGTPASAQTSRPDRGSQVLPSYGMSPQKQPVHVQQRTARDNAAAAIQGSITPEPPVSEGKYVQP